ncbi:MAG: hypothetical protein M1834_003586 [Cirrosporium novae-zelandiae]|nr:MAG: hypothetical protein M1834_003586 [Cirrosporium novae-zelandiae]
MSPALPDLGNGLHHRNPLLKRWSSFIVASFILVALIATYQWLASSAASAHYFLHGTQGKGSFNGRWDYTRDGRDLQMDQLQCEGAFPGLFDEIDRAVMQRKAIPVTIEELDNINPETGYFRVMIYDNELYIIETGRDIYSRGLATLEALNRAILSSPDILPNIEFVFNSDYRVKPSPQWVFARRPEDEDKWLMPDFGDWAGDRTLPSTFKQLQHKARLSEVSEWTWNRKIDELVEESQPIHHTAAIVEYCHYKYLAHKESDRTFLPGLKSLQTCQAVILSPQLNWIQAFHPLMSSAPGPQQNYIRMDTMENATQLEDKLRWLREHDAEAEQIALNSVTTFRDRYLTPAAEMCYWRKLVRGWREVSFEPEFSNSTNGRWRGVPFERYGLQGLYHRD